MKVQPKNSSFKSLFTKKPIIFGIFILLLSINGKQECTLSSEGETKVKSEENIKVSISGAVKFPGLYNLKKDARLNDLISASGGFDNANSECYNLAEKLIDEENIKIKSRKQSCDEDLKININKAGVGLLTLLSGIGTTRAENIIGYREENGKFEKIEDLKNVTGIGESTFNKIKGYIDVK